MIKRLILSIQLISACLFIVPCTASAANIYKGVNCTEASGSAVCTDNKGKDNLTGKGGALEAVTNILAFIAGAAAVIIILISAMRFVMSGSDISTNSRTDTDVENARHTLVNALIGLAVIALARILVLYVIKKV